MQDSSCSWTAGVDSWAWFGVVRWQGAVSGAEIGFGDRSFVAGPPVI